MTEKTHYQRNQDNIKIYHRIAALITFALFGLMLWDILGNASEWFTVLLIIMGSHLFVQLILILLTFWTRFDQDDESSFRKVVLYQRFNEGPVAMDEAKPATQKVPAAKPATTKATATTKAAPAKERPSPRYDYEGDIHEVVDLEGIGPTYARRLMDAGIFHTQHLLFASDARLVKLTGARKQQVQLWKAMSQLAKINGIGPQYAEALARAGIDLEVLRKGEPVKLANQVKSYLEGLKSNVLGGGIGAKRIATWQKEAKKMHKVPIDLGAIEPIRLESKAAIDKGVAKKASKPKKSPIGA